MALPRKRVGGVGAGRHFRRPSRSTLPCWLSPSRPMQGRDFLELAREVVLGGTEKHWRCTVGRAYYAVVLECRDALARWSYPLPPGESVHRWVRMRFDYPADADLNFIGTRTGRL